MKVLVPEGPLRAHLAPLPDGVVLVSEPEDDVELAVIDPTFAPRLDELLSRLPRLRVVQSTQAGIEKLLPRVPKGITVCNASGAHDIPVAEWIVLVLLAIQRRLVPFLALQARSTWDANVNLVSATGSSDIGPIDDLEGANVLIVGYGSIGRAVEARLAPFGARFSRIAAHPREGVATLAALPELLPRSDAVIVLVPMSPETKHLVDAGFLRQMKDGAILVNAARGGVVDTDALLAELHAKRLHAALDVTDPEPLPPSHPLWSAPNVIITPHIAGSTRRWLERAYALAGDQIRRFVRGEPLLNVRSS